MSARRNAHETRHTTSGRDETGVTPCVGQWHTYDTLIEGDADNVRYAVEAAKALCHSCPIVLQCFADNRDELWVQTIVQGYRRKGRAMPERSAA